MLGCRPVLSNTKRGGFGVRVQCYVSNVACCETFPSDSLTLRHSLIFPHLVPCAAYFVTYSTQVARAAPLLPSDPSKEGTNSSGMLMSSNWLDDAVGVNLGIMPVFGQKVVQSFEHHGLTYLVYTEKTGGKLAMHYHLTRRLTKQVLTFKRAEFAHLKAKQDTREWNLDHAPPLQRNSFNRFATFGTGAQNLVQYAEVFKKVVPNEVKLFEDDNVQFLLVNVNELECAYSSCFELPCKPFDVGVIAPPKFSLASHIYLHSIKLGCICTFNALPMCSKSIS